MNTHKFTGDMSSQVEADRDQLVEMREVLQWANENVECATHYTGPQRWKIELWALPDVHAPTLYAALYSAWSNRGKT